MTRENQTLENDRLGIIRMGENRQQKALKELSLGPFSELMIFTQEY